MIAVGDDHSTGGFESGQGAVGGVLDMHARRRWQLGLVVGAGPVELAVADDDAAGVKTARSCSETAAPRSPGICQAMLWAIKRGVSAAWAAASRLRVPSRRMRGLASAWSAN